LFESIPATRHKTLIQKVFKLSKLRRKSFLQLKIVSSNFYRMELATSTSSNPAGSEMSAGQECPLLRLPPELLLSIARLVIHKDPLTRVPDYSSLIPFSLSHGGIRHICISAGLFRQISPRANFRRFKEFGDSLDIRRITSLGVDLGNEKVWAFCAHVLSVKRNLEELCVIGTTARFTAKFCASNLAKRIAEFRGRSLVFRRALFTKLSVSVLAKIGGRGTVTSIAFDRSKLHFNPWRDATQQGLSFPLFPSVTRIKYIGAPLDSLRHTSVENFVHLFMRNCRLTHFEVSYGFTAKCCGYRGTDDPDFDAKIAQILNSNRNLFLSMGTIYDALSQFSSKTLQVFLDRDSRSDTFVDKSWVYAGTSRPPAPPPFRQMKLLILRVKDLSDLMRRDHPADDKFCSASIEIPCVGSSPLSVHHHSLWRYLSFQYAYFCESDCVVVETDPVGFRNDVTTLLWDSAASRFFNEAQYVARRMGNLRYFVVGNQSDGYSGIERDMAISWQRNHLGVISWAYKPLETDCCVRLLVERGFGPRIS
jgi:hypothetical protein